MYKTPLCYIAGAHVPYAYIGLLGLSREGQEEPETETAITLLRKEGYEFDKILVATTLDALNSWGGLRGREMQKIVDPLILELIEMNDIQRVEARIEDKMTEVMKSHIVILDCTSGTRPAGIAFYRLSDKWKVPLIYVYESSRKILWLKSREDIIREFRDILPKHIK